MMPAIQADFAPVKNPAPSARPRIPNMMTMIARAKGPEAMPARTDAPPKMESKPPAAAIIAIIVTPIGLLGFGEEDCIIPRFHFYMISLLDVPMLWAMSKTMRSPRTLIFAHRCLFATASRSFSGVLPVLCRNSSSVTSHDPSIIRKHYQHVQLNPHPRSLREIVWSWNSQSSLLHTRHVEETSRRLPGAICFGAFLLFS